MRKILVSAAFLASGVVCSYGQKKSTIGFSFNMTDFRTPQAIKNSSFSDGIKDMQLKEMIPGFSVVYWQGLTNKLDLSIRYNGGFDPNFKSTKDLHAYYNELEGSFHARLFKDAAAVNPFLSAGIGAGNYWTKGFQPYSPLGVGLQFNLLSETYIHLQANYRVSFDQNKLPNNLFFSLGFSQNLHTPKKQELKPIPEAAPVAVDNDRDKDGVLNDADKCPDVAGLAKYAGCPIPDTDNDGVNDELDKCPTVAGLAKYDGCPIPDTDGDGINDENDKCPNAAGVAKYAGCPIPDTDGDGVNDEEDKCPSVAGPASNFGCPEIKKEIVAKVNKAAGSIYFATGSAKLLAKSNASLNAVAKTLTENPELKVHIDGHTDNTGSEAKNQVLSEQRAEAVKAYLIKKGVDESRLASQGFGQNSPIADNKTAAGRTKNRRVELNLTNY
jgi:OOP family OmpA-OmpF porin